MSFLGFLKNVGSMIVKGAKAVVAFLTGASTAAKVVIATAAVAVPVALAVKEIVKIVKRVKDNKAPSNIVEQSLINDDDAEDSSSKRSYRKTVKNIAKNIGKREMKPIKNKKDLLKELKRTCEEIDRERANADFDCISERKMREARAEMDRIAKKVKRRKCLA